MQILPGEIKQASWINLPTSTSLFANGTLPPQLESCFFLVSGKLISYLSSWAELRDSWQNVRVDWQRSDQNGFQAGQLVCWLKGRSCSDTAGANHWLFPAPPEPKEGVAYQSDLNACCKRGRSSLSLWRWRTERRRKLLFCLIKGGQVVLRFTEP